MVLESSTRRITRCSKTSAQSSGPARATAPSAKAFMLVFAAKWKRWAPCVTPTSSALDDAGTDSDGPFLVMEFLDGESLSGLVSRHRRLPVAEACELIRQAAIGLQVAHESGLIHRDVKPSNLMLARTSSSRALVVVIDWGLVKRTCAAGPDGAVPSDSLTPSKIAMGTADYIAPEQARDARAVDIRADVYSLGVTLFCLLAGKPPFHGRSDVEKMMAHQFEAFPPLGNVRADVPPPLQVILNRMVEKNPVLRFATPGDVAAALQSYCCPESRLIDLLERAVTSQPPKPPRPPRPLLPWLIAAACLLVAASVSLGLLLRGKNGNAPIAEDIPARSATARRLRLP